MPALNLWQYWHVKNLFYTCVFLSQKLLKKTDSIWNKLWCLGLWSASLKTCGERVRDFSTSASPGRALSKSDGCQQLFYYVGKSLSNKSLKVYIYSPSHTPKIFPYVIALFISYFNMQQWEGLVELLGLESQISGSLDFIYKY